MVSIKGVLPGVNLILLTEPKSVVLMTNRRILSRYINDLPNCLNDAGNS